ncbi:MAG TPA: hypothetical protein VFW35_02785 [Sphingomicrobium sp.]|nr:hypothetical protein [Sphingomicrobium sp.]
MHYFFEDLSGLAAATPLALLLLVIPGFGIAALLGRAGLIRQAGSKHACWGLLLGPALLPAVDALLVRWLGFGAMLALHLGLAAAGARPAWEAIRKVPPRWWLAIAFCWAAVAWANVDFDWNGELYQSAFVIDTVKHAAVVGSLATHGIPLRDPFFARPGGAGYYYYFYLGPALLHWLGRPLIDSRAAFAAGTLAILLAFPAMLLLVADAAALIGEGARRRFFRILLLLCCVSGLDLLPGLWFWAKTGYPLPDLDWWSEEVRWTLSSLLFQPHHMTAVMAVLAGCLIVVGPGRLATRALVAGLAFATAFGCSVWVAVAAAAVLALWWVYERVRTGAESPWALPLSGVAALVISLPQIADIATSRIASGPPLAFALRSVGPARTLPHSPGEWIVHLAVLPGAYLIEFGIFALGAIFFLTRGRLDESRATPIGRFLLVSAPVTLILVTFVRSAVMYNDFGWRAIWLAQVPALLWTASVLTAQRELLPRSAVWTGALALGLVAAVWDMTGMRIPFSDRSRSYVNDHPDMDYDLRGAYRWADQNLSPQVIVQHNPTGNVRAMDFGLYSDRGVAVADGDARLFGASQAAVEARIALLEPIFNRDLPAGELRQRATAAGADAILLTSLDPLWRAHGAPPSDWTCQYRSARSCLMLLRKPR